MADRLKNKRCLIVGGTGAIGLAAARRFLEQGASLVISGLTAAEGAAAMSHLKKGDGARFIPCDATDAAQVEKLYQESLAFLGGIDVLYHVAGASGRRWGDGPLHECTEEGWHRTIDANLKSAFLTNRAALRQMLAQGTGGAILNLATALALAPAARFFDTCAYTAAKGGLMAMSRLAAASYAARNIRVNVLAPGLIDTPMSQRAVNDPEIRRFLQSKQPLSAGPGQPDACSEAAVFLCSDEARLITGAVIPVDGGWCVADGPAT